jgi:hypothetical protein
MTSIKIMKHRVQSTTRRLSAKWTFETPSGGWVDKTIPCNLSLRELVKQWMLATQYTKIPLYESEQMYDQLEEIRWWCEENAKCSWSSSKDDLTITTEIFKQELAARIKAGNLNPPPVKKEYPAQQGVDIEAEIMTALAEEITHEVDQEIIRGLSGSTQAQLAKSLLKRSKRPVIQFYYFSDVNEALRFKLTWGGE